MFCQECGKSVEEGVAFCPNCGAKVGATLQAVSPSIQPIKKPMGVIFVGVWNVFWGIQMVLVGLSIHILVNVGLLGVFGIAEGSPFGVGKLDEQYIIETWIVSMLGYLMLLFGMFEITAAYGIWSLTRWGRSLTVVLCVISILFTLLSLIFQKLNFGPIILYFLNIAIPVAIILHLSRPDVKRLFQ